MPGGGDGGGGEGGGGEGGGGCGSLSGGHGGGEGGGGEGDRHVAEAQLDRLLVKPEFCGPKDA